MRREEIFEVVRANIIRIVDGVKADAIREEISLAELGADSLQIVEVVSRSMKELRLKVPRTELSQAANLRDLLDLFEKAAATTHT
jgi:acyl carrier protein